MRVDPVWEASYAAGHSQLYPWDAVVSFVFRYAPKERARENVRILEVGCGTGSNLWFAAREGFAVCGIDGSPSAIAQARERFARDGLVGDFRVATFDDIPFDDDHFDLALDRAALSCVGHAAGRAAVAEVARVLCSGGFFFFNPYSERHSSAVAGTPGADGLVENIVRGNLAGTGGISFYGRDDVERAFPAPWRIRFLEHMERSDLLDESNLAHAEWRVVAELMRRARVTLRPADGQDAGTVFSWRNTHFVASRSTSGQIVEHCDHKAWFVRSLASPDRLLLIVCIDDEDAGVVRFDRVDNETAVISVYLDESKTGYGAGIVAIRGGSARAREVWPAARIEAYVRNDNLLGRKAFAKAGYTRIESVGCPSDHTAYTLDDGRDD